MSRNTSATEISPDRDGEKPPTEIISAFQGEFCKGKLEPAMTMSAIARFSLGSLIPALYMLIIGAVAYATFHHALFGMHFRVTNSVVVIGFLYLLPLVSGAALMALLLRPFFPLIQLKHSSFESLPDNDGQLQDLATQISLRMGMKPSIKLAFSMHPEISIKPDGILGAARHRLNLTIGLPLASVLSGQQLAVLMSHELAHFSHSVFAHIYRAMMLVDDWFRHSINGEDGWLDKFAEFEHNGESSLLVVAGLLGKAAITGNDYLLRGLYFLYTKLSRPALLTLEKDADQSALLICGSSAFSEALDYVSRVQKSWDESVRQLQNNKRVTLVDDFAGWVQKSIDKSGVSDINCGLPGKSVNLRDSLSPLEQRKANALADDVSGILKLAKPARALFRDFNGLCKRLTPFFYREIGLAFSLHDLQPVMLNDQQHRLEKRLHEKLDEYTSSTFLPDVVWDTASASTVAKLSDEKKRALVEASIAQFRSYLPDFREALTRYNDCRMKNIFGVSLALRLEQGYVSDEFITQQSGELHKEKENLQRYNDILGTYSRCSGLRASCAVLLLPDSKKMLRGLQLLTHLQTLHTVQRRLLAAQISYDLMGTLYSRILEHVEIGLQKTLEAHAEKLVDANRVITATLIKLPGELKGVDDLSKLLEENVRDAHGTGHDTARRAYNEFATLARLYKSLNLIISGHLANLARGSEQLHNIEPVRLILKTGHVNAA